jgi:hypothetical protein
MARSQRPRPLSLEGGYGKAILKDIEPRPIEISDTPSK